jgi:ATP-binding cassette, subfamily B, multidrug efflux pump
VAYTVGGVLTIAYAIGFQLVPLATGAVVDALRAMQTGAHDLGAVRAGVVKLAWIALAVAVLRLASRITVFRAARQIEYEIRNDLLEQLQRLPQSYFGRNRTGDLMSRAVNDLNSIRLFLGMGILNLVQTPILYVAAFLVLVSIDWSLAVFVVTPYLLFVGIARFFARRMHPASLAVQEQLGALASVGQENAAGVLVVRSAAMEPQEAARFAVANHELYARWVRFAKVQLGMQPTIALLPALALVLLLYIGGSRVQSGALSLGDFTVFNAYLAMLTFPTMMMGFVVAMAQRGMASLQRIGDVLDVVPSIRDAAQPARIERIRGDVEFRDLSIAFPGREERPALAHVSFAVEAGQTIGVVGSVGSGKTTLVSVIPRLLEVPDGAVCIDGVELNQIPLARLRSSIAMVPQDSFLFSATVAENIAFGRPDADPEEIREAARRAHVLDDIEDLVNRFDTLVGERGITLSGGQRQRVALARALMLDPAILILDDSLASVDAVTEEAILKDLREARAGRTCFIVAHRLSAVRDADRIVVLDEGRVVEIGSHEDLVRQGGVYARVHRQQLLEAELESDEA